jgi:DNA topoisomerase-1
MGKKLLIVESPAKAKTIEKFLGGDFTVKSSYGHVRDLEKGNALGVDVDNGYAPNYVVSPEKNKVVRELKEASKQAQEVWLATDEDREGEAISWHLCQVLGLDEHTTRRIVFREITKPAIQKAVQQPRTLNLNLVDAQQARRVLDRLVGWELSGVLWKKVKTQLSAGRVQSVAVKLVVERERDILDFRAQAFFRLVGTFHVSGPNGKTSLLKAESPDRFDDASGAEAFLKGCVGAQYKVSDIQVRPQKRRPAPPFTTSTMQQEASRKLGFSVNRTMSVAQSLYEQGFISYMRTDSTNLSESALQSIGDEINNLFGARYHQLRRFTSKKELAQEAHEAIRPTYAERQQVSANRDEQRLYELIWKRAVASQMADAELEKTVVDIAISTQPKARLVAEGEVLKFDGFLKLYLEGTDEEEEETKGMLPPLTVGQALALQELTATERFTRPPARFTEASLVKKLEELGIGRPSTYAPTITKIMEANRGYVVKDSKEGILRTFQVITLQRDQISRSTGSETTGTTKNVLYPSDLGMLVVDFLDEHFRDIMEYDFTAEIEREFDQIAEGKLAWPTMLDRFYRPFHQTVEKTLKEAERADGERILGVDPDSGRTVLVRMSRQGKPVVQIGAQDELHDGEKPRYANLPPGARMETIELSEALKGFQFPKHLGTWKEEPITVSEGRYGPYVKFGELFVSLPKQESPHDITLERAIELIGEKQQAEKPIGYFQDQPITKGKGRFGPFVKWADLYVNIPKSIDIDRITEAQAVDLIGKKIEKEASRFINHWPELQLSVENGRWGPFIRFKKAQISFPKSETGKVTAEQAKAYSMESIREIVEKEIPDAFKPKKAPTKKK